MLALLLAAIAFGVNWMAYEQRRANSGIFVAYPSQKAGIGWMALGY